MSTDGFGALETYLRVAPRAHLGLDLAAAVGPEAWATLKRAAVLRHVLTRNAGVVDDRFLARRPG